jgi:hypothetical protein
VSVLLCLTLADEAGLRGMLKSLSVAVAVVMTRRRCATVPSLST